MIGNDHEKDLFSLLETLKDAMESQWVMKLLKRSFSPLIKNSGCKIIRSSHAIYWAVKYNYYWSRSCFPTAIKEYVNLSCPHSWKTTLFFWLCWKTKTSLKYIFRALSHYDLSIEKNVNDERVFIKPKPISMLLIIGRNSLVGPYLLINSLDYLKTDIMAHKCKTFNTFFQPLHLEETCHLTHLACSFSKKCYAQ